MTVIKTVGIITIVASLLFPLSSISAKQSIETSGLVLENIPKQKSKKKQHQI